MNSSVDVFVIQKQTALERYGDVSFEYAHKEHIKSRSSLLSALEELKLTYQVFHLDDLKKNQIPFYDEANETSGLRPKKKLVISLGGDGTLLHASHHVGGDVRLLGINSSPDHSVGHMCFVKQRDILSSLEEVLDDRRKSKIVRRLKVKLWIGHSHLPLALNDVLFCNKHPAATSRYRISIQKSLKKDSFEQSEHHVSSGIWVSTAAGSTAAISSYGFGSVPITSSEIFIATREPYRPYGESLVLSKFSLDGKEKSLSFFSQMRQGLVCVDGPDFCESVGFDEVIDISSPEEGSLLLI